MLTLETTRRITVTIGILISARASAQPIGGHESDQGTRVFGTSDPKLEGVVIPYTPTPGQGYSRIWVDAGRLKTDNGDVHPTHDMPFALLGAQSVVGAPVDVALTILDARQHQNMYTPHELSTAWEYQVTIGGVGGKPLCFAESNWALAVPGSWHDFQLVTKPDALAGETPPYPMSFTFACLPVQDPNVAESTKTRGLVTTPPAAACTGAPAVVAGSSAANRTQPSVGQLRRLVLAQPKWHGGASAKCIDLGYAPWLGGTPALGQPAKGYQMPKATPRNARRMHNVCVQAMTADYAGNSQSHTVAGTVIELFDLRDLPLRADPLENKPNGTEQPDGFALASAPKWAARRVEGMQFEGVWTEDSDGRAYARCLSRARWSAIDPAQLSHWTSCEDLELKQLTQSDPANGRSDDAPPFLFTYSSINERVLWRVRNGAGTDWITTTHVTVSGQGLVGPGNVVSHADPVFEGYIISPNAMTEHYDQVLPLFLYTDGRSYVTTTERPPTGYHAVYWTDDLLARDNVNVSRGPAALPPPGYTVERSMHDRRPVPEGYVFCTAPLMPKVKEYLRTPAIAPQLHIWSKTNAFCTTSLPGGCEGYSSGHRLGFLLFPNEAKRPPYHRPLYVSGPRQIPLVDPPDHEIHLERSRESERIPLQAPALGNVPAGKEKVTAPAAVGH